MTDVFVRRVLSPEEATALVGEKITEPPNREPLPSPKGEPVRIIDEDAGEIIGLLTQLDPDTTRALRASVLGLRMSGVARKGMPVANNARTFGYAPRRPIVRQEACRPSTTATEHPSEHQTLVDLGGALSEQFRTLLPDRADADDQVLAQVLDEWKLEPDALWTSGVVNRTAQLPYHRDGANFHTWSAMPTLRLGVDGGNLYVPEYDLLFPCRDGEVSWFCGRDLVHGVTPMEVRRKGGYRYSIVYYALAGMKDCRTFAEETTRAVSRRTERERAMADEVRGRVNAALVEPKA